MCPNLVVLAPNAHQSVIQRKREYLIMRHLSLRTDAGRGGLGGRCAAEADLPDVDDSDVVDELLTGDTLMECKSPTEVRQPQSHRAVSANSAIVIQNALEYARRVVLRRLLVHFLPDIAVNGDDVLEAESNPPPVHSPCPSTRHLLQPHTPKCSQETQGACRSDHVSFFEDRPRHGIVAAPQLA